MEKYSLSSAGGINNPELPNKSLKQTGRADAAIERFIFAYGFLDSILYFVGSFRPLSLALEF